MEGAAVRFCQEFKKRGGDWSHYLPSEVLDIWEGQKKFSNCCVRSQFCHKPSRVKNTGSSQHADFTPSIKGPHIHNLIITESRDDTNCILNSP